MGIYECVRACIWEFPYVPICRYDLRLRCFVCLIFLYGFACDQIGIVNIVYVYVFMGGIM